MWKSRTVLWYFSINLYYLQRWQIRTVCTWFRKKSSCRFLFNSRQDQAGSCCWTKCAFLFCHLCIKCVLVKFPSLNKRPSYELTSNGTSSSILNLAASTWGSGEQTNPTLLIGMWDGHQTHQSPLPSRRRHLRLDRVCLGKVEVMRAKRARVCHASEGWARG